MKNKKINKDISLEWDRTDKDIGRICSACNSKIYKDNIGDIECKCGDFENEY